MLPTTKHPGLSALVNFCSWFLVLCLLVVVLTSYHTSQTSGAGDGGGVGKQVSRLGSLLGGRRRQPWDQHLLQGSTEQAALSAWACCANCCHLLLHMHQRLSSQTSSLMFTHHKRQDFHTLDTVIEALRG